MVDQSSSPVGVAVRGVPLPALLVLALRAVEQDVLVVLGEADIATADLLYDQVLRALPAPPRPVVVELGALGFCDLHGLDALRDVERAAESAGVTLTFRGPSPQLRRLQRTVPTSCSEDGRRTSALDASDDRSTVLTALATPSPVGQGGAGGTPILGSP